MAVRVSLILCSFGFVLTSFFSTGASAQQCDCQEVVGSCNGAIEFVKSYGSPPSYGAEFVVHSSESKCSKVEYLINNTPHTTVLVNKRKEEESTFGTSPITSSAIRYSKCSICKNTAAASAGSANDVGATSSPFEGTWTASDRNIFGYSNQATYNLKVDGGTLSGTLTDPKGQVRPLSGTVSGNEASVSCSNCFSMVFRLVNPTTIEFSYPFGSGTLRKQ